MSSETGMLMIAANRTSNAELATRCLISVVTAWPDAVEVPRLPLTIPLSQMPYWR